MSVDVSARGVGAVPEVGNLVRARGAMWVVTGITHDRPQDDHVVDLISVDSANTDRVVWQVERGTEVIERVDLPTPTPGNFDAPGDADAFLNAAAWGAITSAERTILQSPFRAGIRIEDYQLVPLLKAIDQPRANLLIADDVGLGKTIMAGLIVHEFQLRNRINNCLIVCPASLMQKWKNEMAEKFGMDFLVLDTAELGQIRRRMGAKVNPLNAHPYLIASIQWLRRPDREPMIDAVLPTDDHLYPRTFDMLIVDEAHHVAPSGDGAYAVDTQQTRLIRRLSPHFEHKLFLTATPHNGKPDAFQGLMALLDSRVFARGVTPTPAQLDQAMVRRLKSHIIEIKGDDAPFAARTLNPIELNFTDEEHDAYQLLLDYAASRRSAAGGNTEKEHAAGFVTLLMKKRFLSSPRAFADTLDTHIATAARKAGKDASPHQALRELYEAALEGHDTDQDVEDSEAEALDASMGTGTTLTTEQVELLDQMRGWADAHRNASSAKSTATIDWLKDVCLDDRGQWTDERVVIFTEYRSTLNWFKEQLISAGLADKANADRWEIIEGDTPPEDRERITGDFNYDPADRPVRILLCTDAASEGIDLHLRCHRLLHLDIPFSPTKMEQRNGRIDRHGQPHDTADIYYFTAANDPGPAGDTFFLDLIVRKTDEIRNDLGDVNELLGDITSGDTFAGVQKTLERGLTTTDRNVIVGHQQRRAEVMGLIRQLQQGIEDARAAIDSTRQDLDLQPEQVAHVVEVALRLDNQPTLEPTETEGVFVVPSGLSMDWQGALVGLWDHRADEQRPVTFDASLVQNAMEGPVYLHLAHPLVSRATELLRAQLWTRTSTATALSRVTARTYDPNLLPDHHPAKGHLSVVAHARVVITGGDGSRLHESVVKIGGRYAQRWARFDSLTQGDQVWAARTSNAEPDTEMYPVLWEEIRESLLKGLYDRGEEVARQMAARLDSRKAEEEARFDEMVAEMTSRAHETMTKLKDDADGQLSLLPPAEQDQWELDLKILSKQIEDVQGIRDAEKAAIAARYDVREPRVFPMSVTFLTPETR